MRATASMANVGGWLRKNRVDSKERKESGLSGFPDSINRLEAIDRGMNAPQGRPPTVLHSLGTSHTRRRRRGRRRRRRRRRQRRRRRRRRRRRSFRFSVVATSAKKELPLLFLSLSACTDIPLQLDALVFYDFLRLDPFCRQPPAADRDQRSRHARFITTELLRSSYDRLLFHSTRGPGKTRRLRANSDRDTDSWIVRRPNSPSSSSI